MTDRHRWGWMRCAVVGALAAAAHGPPARAQAIQANVLPAEFPDDYVRGQSVGVALRPRPDYDPIGALIGGFQVFPSIDSVLAYTSNVLATPMGAVGAGYAGLDPAVSAQSTWSNAQVAMAAGAHLKQFFSHASENETGWFVTTDDQVNLTSYDVASIGGGFERTYLSRDAGTYPAGSAAPVGLLHGSAYLREAHEAGLVKLLAAANFDSLRYQAVPSLSGGTIEQATNDRDVWRLSGRGEYALTPDTALFGQVSYSRTAYTHLAAGEADPSSNTFRALTGATFDTAFLIRGTLGLGVESRTFGAGAYRALTGVTAAAKLEYFPTQLVTVTGSFRRLIEDTQATGSSGYFNTGADIRVDYELLRNLLLDAQGDFEQDDFAGISRTDRIVSGGLGARYLVNRRLQLHGDLTWLHREASAVFSGPVVRGPVFDEIRLAVGIKAQL